MWKKHKAKSVKLLIVILDVSLLVSFLAQTLVIGCLIAYGYIPIPAKWANQQLLKKPFDGFHIQADSFRLKLWQEIELLGLKIYHNETKNPILEADSTEVQFGFKRHGDRQFDLTKLIVTNGTLMMPAVYAPDGKRTAADGNGLQLVEHIGEHLPQLPVAMITAFGSMDTAIAALKAGAFDYVQKPVDLDQLRKLVDTALRLPGPSAPRLEGGVNLLGDSPVMETLRRQIQIGRESGDPVPFDPDTIKRRGRERLRG